MSEETVLYFLLIFMLNSLLFSSLGWNVFGPKTRNSSSDFASLCIFKLKISWNQRPEVFWKSLRPNNHVENRFFKLIWCMCDQSCLRPFDGKYLIATAPFAVIQMKHVLQGCSIWSNDVWNDNWEMCGHGAFTVPCSFATTMLTDTLELTLNILPVFSTWSPSYILNYRLDVAVVVNKKRSTIRR